MSPEKTLAEDALRRIADLADKSGPLQSALANVNDALEANDFQTGVLTVARDAAAALVASAQHPEAADERALADLVAQGDTDLARIAEEQAAYLAVVVDELTAAITAQDRAMLQLAIGRAGASMPPVEHDKVVEAEMLEGRLMALAAALADLRSQEAREEARALEDNDIDELSATLERVSTKLARGRAVEAQTAQRADELEIRAWLVTGSARKQELLVRRAAWEEDLLDALRIATTSRDRPRIEMQLCRAEAAQPPFECARIDEAKAVVARIDAVREACARCEAELDEPLPDGDDSHGLREALTTLEQLSRAITRGAPKPYVHENEKRLERLADLLRERRSTIMALKQRDEARREREAERERERQLEEERKQAELDHAWELARQRERAEQDLARQRYAIRQMEQQNELQHEASLAQQRYETEAKLVKDRYEFQLGQEQDLAQRRYEQEQYIAQNRYGQQQLGYNGY